MVVTEKCDVYSFGVLVLEVLMGKHPGELITDLHSLVGTNIHLKDVLDDHLSPPTGQKIAYELDLMLNLAISCLHTNPQSRPTMQRVFVLFFILVMSSPSSTEREIDEYQDVSSGSFKSGEGSTSYSSSSSDEHYSSEVPGISSEEFHEMQRRTASRAGASSSKVSPSPSQDEEEEKENGLGPEPIAENLGHEETTRRRIETKLKDEVEELKADAIEKDTRIAYLEGQVSYFTSSLEKAREEAISAFKKSDEYKNRLDNHYAAGYEDFRADAKNAFPDLNFDAFKIPLATESSLLVTSSEDVNVEDDANNEVSQDNPKTNPAK
ncbi:serine/threonine-protein kinase RIPK-like [Quercus suber]|uniref:serine/threonine-protein kinase RIPK-like n=1 Tax=Quercus suber TaxID=58331 RepID=UPI0032DEBCF2